MFEVRSLVLFSLLPSNLSNLISNLQIANFSLSTVGFSEFPAISQIYRQLVMTESNPSRSTVLRRSDMYPSISRSMDYIFPDVTSGLACDRQKSLSHLGIVPGISLYGDKF